jgi:hypothetical protein
VALPKCGSAAKRRINSRTSFVVYGANEYVHFTAKRVSRTCGGFAGAMLVNCMPSLKMTYRSLSGRGGSAKRSSGLQVHLASL